MNPHEEGATKTATIQLPAELKEWAQAYAQSQGQTLNDLIADVMREARKRLAKGGAQ